MTEYGTGRFRLEWIGERADGSRFDCEAVRVRSRSEARSLLRSQWQSDARIAYAAVCGYKDGPVVLIDIDNGVTL